HCGWNRRLLPLRSSNSCRASTLSATIAFFSRWISVSGPLSSRNSKASDSAHWEAGGDVGRCCLFLRPVFCGSCLGPAMDGNFLGVGGLLLRWVPPVALSTLDFHNRRDVLYYLLVPRCHNQRRGPKALPQTGFHN